MFSFYDLTADAQVIPVLKICLETAVTANKTDLALVYEKMLNSLLELWVYSPSTQVYVKNNIPEHRRNQTLVTLLNHVIEAHALELKYDGLLERYQKITHHKNPPVAVKVANPARPGEEFIVFKEQEQIKVTGEPKDPVPTPHVLKFYYDTRGTELPPLFVVLEHADMHRINLRNAITQKRDLFFYQTYDDGTRTEWHMTGGLLLGMTRRTSSLKEFGELLKHRDTFKLESFE